jgi:hypothetical protein
MRKNKKWAELKDTSINEFLLFPLFSYVMSTFCYAINENRLTFWNVIFWRTVAVRGGQWTVPCKKSMGNISVGMKHWQRSSKEDRTNVASRDPSRTHTETHKHIPTDTPGYKWRDAWFTDSWESVNHVISREKRVTGVNRCCDGLVGALKKIR